MNKKNFGADTNPVQVIVDIVAIALALGITELLNKYKFDTNLSKLVIIAALFCFIVVISNKEAKLYDRTLFFYTDRFLKIITKAWLNATFITAVLLFVIDVTAGTKVGFYWFAGISYLLLIIDMFVSRFFSRVFINRKAPRAAYVGAFNDFQKFNYFLNKTSLRVEQLGYISYSEQEKSDYKGRAKMLGSLDQLEDIVREYNLDQVYFMQKNEMTYGMFNPYIELCMDMGITAKVVIESPLAKQSSSYISSVGQYPVVTYHTISLNNYALFIKRVMDFILSFFAIIVSSPIMLVTALAIKLDSPGPVIFKQKRVGKNGRLFNMYKFRSMCLDADDMKEELQAQNEFADGMMFKIKDDPRITRVGKFIRKTSIDELPQFFNVLIGNMSLVGTRPPTTDEVEKYKRTQWRRISVKPGITGMWQVSGRSNITDFDEIVRLDVQYIDNWSILLDIKILFMTVGAIFKKKGAY